MVSSHILCWFGGLKFVSFDRFIIQFHLADKLYFMYAEIFLLESYHLRFVTQFPTSGKLHLNSTNNLIFS